MKTLIYLMMCGAAIIALGCSAQKFGLQDQSEGFGELTTYNSDVDVLWVVDTSGSMAPRQQGLASQMGVFMSALDQTGLNYHIAVTTMDAGNGGEKGRFLATPAGTPTVLTSAVPDITSILSQRVQAGSAGSNLERGLESMKDALTAPNLNGVNAGFFRPNALLVVIFLTDEDDHSTPADYLGFLNTLKPKTATGAASWVAQFIGVTPTDPSCKTAEWGYSSPGLKYISLANASGGAVESICNADFNGAVTNVKARVLAIVTEYPLSKLPNVNTIVVHINGVLIAQDLNNGWQYDSTDNSIKFYGTAVPPVGSYIQVDFSPGGFGQ